ncbi:MAG: SDR family oxidoreductase, partial [Clostridia bacterium]|nr:SDR family oxidoreductase [Clostridia bacterium]
MNNTALVTGASGGLGLEFAKLLAKDGNDLLLVARNGHRLEEIKDELEKAHGVKVYFLACDLTQDDSANKVYDYAKENSLQIDVLINNAGFGDFGNYLDSVWEKQRDMINLNVLALMRLTYLFVPEMKERGKGKILNVASIASFQPGPLMSVYYASKAFVLSFSEALAVELKKTGVTVTALCPGPVRTCFEKAANLAYSG